MLENSTIKLKSIGMNCFSGFGNHSAQQFSSEKNSDNINTFLHRSVCNFTFSYVSRFLNILFGIPKVGSIVTLHGFH